MENLNLATLPKYLSNEASAWELLERLRWPNGEIVCPHCGVIDPKHYFIAARSGERQTRTGATTYRRLWKCRHCAKQFSVLVDTIFESSKVPVSKWLLAMWLFNAGKNGVPALELQRHLDVAYQTAWFTAHRLRVAATRKPLVTLWSMRGSPPFSPKNPSSGQFEEFVAAALRVAPKGLSGKHRRELDDSRVTKMDSEQ